MSHPVEPSSQTFGNFSNELLATNQCLLIDFASGLIPKQQFWSNSSLSAKFVADYVCMFFPASEGEHNKLQIQIEISGTVRYIANELLENAVKFSDKTSRVAPQLGLNIHPGKIIVFVKNSTQADSLTRLKTLIDELMTSDPSDLYVERLEQNLAANNSEQSGLGFITILSNYQTRIGWKFEAIQTEPGKILVTTMVQLSYDWNIWNDCLSSISMGTLNGNQGARV